MTPYEISLITDGWTQNRINQKKDSIAQAWLTAGLVGRLFDKSHPFPLLKDLLVDFEPSKQAPQISRAEQEAEAKKLNLRGPWA